MYLTPELRHTPAETRAATTNQAGVALAKDKEGLSSATPARRELWSDGCPTRETVL
jgi:hypothetical protein